MSATPILIAVVIGIILGLLLKSLDRGEARPPKLDAGGGEAPGIEELLARGRKIEAIKLYREEHGVGLKVAKEAIDELIAQKKRSPGDR